MSKTTANLNLRVRPSTVGNTPLIVIPNGADIITGKLQNGWRRAFYDGEAGWVSSYYLANIKTVPFIDAAFIHLGKWYIIGGNGPDTFDCSGLTLYVLRDLRYPFDLSDRTANEQMYSFRDGRWKGVKVSREDVQPGDMAFFGYWKTNKDGSREQHASHVVFMITPEWLMGANGGYNATKTIADAKRVGANVRIDVWNYRALKRQSGYIEIWRPIFS